MTLNDPYPRFQGHAIFWRWISQKRDEIHSFSGILIGTYTRTTNSVSSSDLEWLSKTFNDMKRCMVSVWQLNFLFYCCKGRNVYVFTFLPLRHFVICNFYCIKCGVWYVRLSVCHSYYLCQNSLCTRGEVAKNYLKQPWQLRCQEYISQIREKSGFRLSVDLSVTFLYCIWMSKHILILFHWRTILGFVYQTLW